MTSSLGGFRVELVGVFLGGWSDGEKHCGDGGAIGCSLKLGAAKPGGAACSEMEAFK